ncbi:disulfide bond formation protein DsbB [Erwinia tracheiphila]|uniref:Disulfide bond formation protein B n=1 Tax=Erwinia tracheiphila TaxID=65700 RepID=A0A0M2KB33_9GAMM|nr:disulfide bond formation protein DsbB [Erwinia tracheiphila]AXF75706.1 disulfide bond formation protein DsbB [Erwinia tracheiphila]EOS93444.1 disulfide bond formation protein B [Erwinia tracheiphila PSU-1]KKF34482.1 disulfide bond formation protein B [Erwinia tracheiphila]UIA81747.1 disulfide bond formation protein DsbB [Erwinia tracheiphila]UIA86153.1 disulfide bond formation protein DsbB [Erwinia tracheiphila]
MLRYLNNCSRGRAAWLLLAFTAFCLEMIAIYFQHVMMLKPCVMCIYQRCALFGIMGAGLVGAIAPKTPLRWLAIVIWLYSACEGLRLAWEHTMIRLHPNPFTTCDFAASFPTWLPLDKWLPSVFVATGDCAAKQWSFLSLEMPQWLIVIFTVCIVTGLLVLVSQCFREKKRALFTR